MPKVNWQERADSLIKLERKLNPNFDPHTEVFQKMLEDNIYRGGQPSREEIRSYIHEKFGKPPDRPPGIPTGEVGSDEPVVQSEPPREEEPEKKEEKPGLIDKIIGMSIFSELVEEDHAEGEAEEGRPGGGSQEEPG